MIKRLQLIPVLVLFAVAALAAFLVLVEFFEHLSFGVRMFRWSLYSLSGFAGAGIFLLLCGIIPSMRHELERRFFV